MTSGGRERRTNWESVTLIRIYLNITWTQQGLRIGYYDFSQVHSRRYFSKFPRYTAGDISPNFPRYTAGDISPNFPGTQQALFSEFPRYTAGFIFRIFPGTQQVLFVTNQHKIVGIQQVLKLKNVT